MVRVPGICNGDDTTTVLAHLNNQQFRHGPKAHDLHGAWACSDCHAWLDGGYVHGYARDTRDLWHYEAVIRTQLELIKEGIL